MNLNSLIDDSALLGSDEDDESFDEETGEVRTKSNGANGRFDDSSEEEDDEDDEAAAAVCPHTTFAYNFMN
jgi:transcription elongation factor SPT6